MRNDKRRSRSLQSIKSEVVGKNIHCMDTRVITAACVISKYVIRSKSRTTTPGSRVPIQSAVYAIKTGVMCAMVDLKPHSHARWVTLGNRIELTVCFLSHPKGVGRGWDQASVQASQGGKTISFFVHRGSDKLKQEWTCTELLPRSWKLTIVWNIIVWMLQWSQGQTALQWSENCLMFRDQTGVKKKAEERPIWNY